MSRPIESKNSLTEEEEVEKTTCVVCTHFVELILNEQLCAQASYKHKAHDENLTFFPPCICNYFWVFRECFFLSRLFRFRKKKMHTYIADKLFHSLCFSHWIMAFLDDSSFFCYCCWCGCCCCCRCCLLLFCRCVYIFCDKKKLQNHSFIVS